MEYPKIILKSGREKPIRNKHPWVFSGGIKLFPKAKNGSIVAVCDNQERVLGHGFYAPNNQLACRLFDFGSEALDFSSVAYWQAKFHAAFDLRKHYVLSASTNVYRLLFAEGDGLPGVIVDVYNTVAVLQISAKGTELLIETFKKCLIDLGFEHIYLRVHNYMTESADSDLESKWLHGNPIVPVQVTEHGLPMCVDVQKGQKTGFFIDQRENRLLLRQLCYGKSVLNTFCYTGGFSINALLGNASEVVSVDISKDAILKCNENVTLASADTKRHTGVVADVFQFLKETNRLFDIVILDPPAFAKSAKTVPNATRGYKELNMLGLKKVNQHGLVMTYSCSQHIDAQLFQKIVFAAAADVGKNVRILQHLHQPYDHPVSIFHPEGSYLKGLLLYVTDMA